VLDWPAAASSAAVVGSQGFLGRALTAALRATGVHVLEFTRDRPCLTSTDIDAGLMAADSVFWAVSTINPALAEAAPERVRADHTLFEAVLNGLSVGDGRRRVVLLSSGGTVYDPAARPPYPESAAVSPLGAYGRAKLDMEAMLAESSGALGSGVSVRISNAYGPGQPVAPGQGVIAHWLAAAADGRALTMLGNPATTRDYVYVGDVAQALVAIHQHTGILPGTLNVGSGRPTTLAALADIIIAVVDDPAVTLEMAPGRSFDVARTWLDSSLARRVLAWSPRTSLDQGVQQAWSALRSARPERTDASRERA